MVAAAVLTIVGVVAVGAGGLEGGPGTGDATTPDFTGSFVEPPVDRGFEEDELSFHVDIEPRGCDIFGRPARPVGSDR